MGAPRSWQYLVDCLRDPPRSDFAFVPHQYILAPLELSQASNHSVDDASTPIHSRPEYCQKKRPRQRNSFFILHMMVMGIAGVAWAWLTRFPMTPERLYNMQVDVFRAKHEHADFFYHSCLYLGTVFGAVIGGYCGDRLGRAGTLELAAIPLIVGWVLIGVAYGELTVLIGRYLLGGAAGILNVIVPVYLAEVSAAHTRGRVLCAQMLVSALGGMCYLLLGALFMYLSHQYLGFNLMEWKVLALAGVIPGLLLLLVAQKLPDSPTWLISRHDDREAAFKVLLKLYDRNQRVAENETNAIIHAKVLGATEQRHHGAFFRPVLLCATLFTLRTVSAFLLEPAITSSLANARVRGNNGTSTSTSFVLTLIGVAVTGAKEELLAITFVAAVASIMGMIACFYFVDTRGRPAALQCGCSLVTLACVFLLLSLYQSVPPTRDHGVSLNAFGYAAMLLANAGHQLGLGVVPVIILSELFAVKHRMNAVSLVVVWETIVTTGLAHALPALRASARTSVSIATFCVSIVLLCNITGAVLSVWYIPETKGRSLQDIEAILCGWQPATPRRCTSSNVRLEYGSNDVYIRRSLE